MLKEHLKGFGLKVAAAVPVVVAATVAFAHKVGATAITYTPLVSGTDTKDTFDGMVTDYKTAILAIVVTIGVAGVALAWLRRGFKGAKRV